MSEYIDWMAPACIYDMIITLNIRAESGNIATKECNCIQGNNKYLWKLRGL
jgi:hypothetical protein